MTEALREKFEEQAQQLGYWIARSLVNEECYHSNETQAAWELVKACQPEAAFLIESYGNSPRTGYTFKVDEIFLGTMTAARRYAKARDEQSKRLQYSARKVPVVR